MKLKFNANAAAICSLLGISSAVGATAGWFLGSSFKPTPVVQNDVYLDGPVQFSDKYETLQKVLKASGAKDIGSFKNIDLTNVVGKNGVTLGDVLEVSQYLTYSNDYVKITTRNFTLSNAVIQNKQDTSGTWIKNKDSYFRESLSYSSNAAFGERSYNISSDNPNPLSKPLDNQIEYFRVNNNKSALSCDFKDSKKQFYYINVPEDKVSEGYKSYSTMFGLSMFKPFNYDYNEKNIKKDESGAYSNCTVNNSKTGSKVTYENKMMKTDTGYTMTFALNLDENQLSVTNYASYIFTTTRDAPPIAKMKEKPKFIDVGVEVNVDKNLNILSVHSDENYNVISGLVGAVPSYCTGDLKFEYSNKAFNIPKLQEVITYEK